MKSTRFGEHHGSNRKIVTFANPEVLAFYKTLPFNFREVCRKQCGSNSISGPASCLPRPQAFAACQCSRARRRLWGRLVGQFHPPSLRLLQSLE